MFLPGGVRNDGKAKIITRQKQLADWPEDALGLNEKPDVGAADVARKAGAHAVLTVEEQASPKT
jgi:hypothetical protein